MDAILFGVDVNRSFVGNDVRSTIIESNSSRFGNGLTPCDIVSFFIA